MTAYIKSLREAFMKMHGCKASYVETVPIKEVFQGETVWEGYVEVFKLKGHSQATTGYAWGRDVGESSEAVTVLGVGAIQSPVDAVRASILAQLRSDRRN
jgi:hypothetical protein